MQHQRVIAILLVALQLTSQAAADLSRWPANGLSGHQLKQYLLELHTNSTVLDTDLLDDPNVRTLHRRHLLADAELSDWANYVQQGRYVVIKNPSMPGVCL